MAQGLAEESLEDRFINAALRKWRDMTEVDDVGIGRDAVGGEEMEAVFGELVACGAAGCRSGTAVMRMR